MLVLPPFNRIMRCISSVPPLRKQGEYWKETIERRRHSKWNSLRGHLGNFANFLPVHEDWVIGKELLARVNGLLEANKVKERLEREADMRLEIQEAAEKNLREESEDVLRKVQNLEDKMNTIQNMLQQRMDKNKSSIVPNQSY